MDTSQWENVDFDQMSPEERAKAKENFLVQFREVNRICSVNFMKVWSHYDKDKSGFLDAPELQAFLKDVLDSQGEATDPETVGVYKKILLSSFDINKDGKLEMSEIAQLMRIEDNFLNKLPHDRSKLSHEQFNTVFAHYDVDGSGFIKGDELTGLIKDIYQMLGHNFPAPDLYQYAQAVREIYDTDQDGLLSKEDIRLIMAKS